MAKQGVIGIVGGVGPMAGIDLHRLIVENTQAQRDQDHIGVVHLSLSSKIADRTAYLVKGGTNPAFALAEILAQLERAGATVAAVPCNTAHAEPIWSQLLACKQERNLSIKLCSITAETSAYCKATFQQGDPLGLLATQGTFQEGMYQKSLEAEGLKCLLPRPEEQALVHQSIYDPEWGIKATAGHISTRARLVLEQALKNHQVQGAKGVILGCTELPLAITSSKGMHLINPTQILARALIRAAAPRKLKDA